MRTYAPADASTVLDRLLEEPSLARGVVHHEVIPAREPAYADMPGWLDERIVRGLSTRGIERLYSHQTEAIEAIHAGEDVVVVTPTASGKSLCYALPTLQAIAEDPAARACSFSRPRPSVRTRSPSSASSRPQPTSRSSRRPMTGTRRRRSAPRSGRPDRSWLRTRTCSTRRSSRTTPSGSSSSNSCSWSSSTNSIPTGACSGATSPTCSGASCVSAPTTAAGR